MNCASPDAAARTAWSGGGEPRGKAGGARRADDTAPTQG